MHIYETEYDGNGDKIIVLDNENYNSNDRSTYGYYFAIDNYKDESVFLNIISELHNSASLKGCLTPVTVVAENIPDTLKIGEP